MAGSVCAPKREQVTEGLRKLLHNVYFTYIIRMTKMRKIRWRAM